MKWKPLQSSLRPVNPFGSKFRLLKGLFVVLFFNLSITHADIDCFGGAVGLSKCQRD